MNVSNRGDLGHAKHLLKTPRLGVDLDTGTAEEGYSVEFFDMVGNTVAVVTVPASALRLPPNGSSHVRALRAWFVLRPTFRRLPARNTSSCLSHRTIWFQLANVWLTKLSLALSDGAKYLNKWCRCSPIDGMPDRGWRGGWGLRSEPPQIGRYILVFECAGQKTSPYSFTVEEIPILKLIGAEFMFPSPLLLGSPDASVTLRVRNHSSQTIRFPHRGVMSELVWVELNKTTGEKWVSSFPVPSPVLLEAAGIERSTIADDTFSWILAGRVPTIVLAPGDIYRLELPLKAVLTGRGGSQTIPDGEYDVRLSTVVQMLVGQRDGSWADLSPIRLNITSVTHAMVSR